MHTLYHSTHDRGFRQIRSNEDLRENMHLTADDDAYISFSCALLSCGSRHSAKDNNKQNVDEQEISLYVSHQAVLKLNVLHQAFNVFQHSLLVGQYSPRNNQHVLRIWNGLCANLVQGISILCRYRYICRIPNNNDHDIEALFLRATNTRVLRYMIVAFSNIFFKHFLFIIQLPRDNVQLLFQPYYSHIFIRTHQPSLNTWQHFHQYCSPLLRLIMSGWLVNLLQVH